ncbi:MAG: homocysteine S-methyltransferase family protein [Candidatus Binatia bacterium]
MTDRVMEELTAAGPVLTDGAWGTELQARGLPAGEIPDCWNLSHPERVEEVARAYVDAGSRIILTNTFRANRIAFEQHPERSRIEEINRAGVAISRRAARARALVFASIGPSGKLLLAREITEAALAAAFAEQAQALAEAGADGIVVETMSDLVEARIAVQAAAATGLPVVACMVFGSGKQRDRTMMGVTAREAAIELTRAGARAIGANCGIGIEHCLPICEALAAATNRPIWIKPNAGLPEFAGGATVYRTDPETFASYLPKLVAGGAKFIGGCCGTTPRFIEALRARLTACP